MDCTKPTAPVSVIIPTFRRAGMLLENLRRLQECVPAPREVLVHVDAGDDETASAVRVAHPDVVLVVSTVRKGPGGGRNVLVGRARNEYVVSFDDDSWPLAPGFFAETCRYLDEYPSVALFTCRIIEADACANAADDEVPREEAISEVDGFSGGGCFFRKSRFLLTGGYLALANAYGMEETDVALRLLDLKETIASVPLDIFHDTDRNTRHKEARINAAQITNTALLAYLRYPKRYWPYGVLQVLNRVRYSVGTRRFGGILTGLFSIPAAAWRHHKHRRTVAPATIQRLIQLRRRRPGANRIAAGSPVVPESPALS